MGAGGGFPEWDGEDGPVVPGALKPRLTLEAGPAGVWELDVYPVPQRSWVSHEPIETAFRRGDPSVAPWAEEKGWGSSFDRDKQILIWEIAAYPPWIKMIT